MHRTTAVPDIPAQRDVFCLRALARVYPSKLVDEVIERCDCKEERVRLLPARFVVYFVLALALFTDSSYREVMRKLVDSLLAAPRRHAGPQPPGRAGRPPAPGA